MGVGGRDKKRVVDDRDGGDEFRKCGLAYQAVAVGYRRMRDTTRGIKDELRNVFWVQSRRDEVVTQ
jgi:hypothetical protein